MRYPIIAIATAFILFSAAPGADAQPAAHYKVVFDGTWSSQSFPKDFPLLAHFSGIIGATHGDGFSIFKEGGTATDGLEHLSEEGKHTPLDQEIDAAIKAGTAGTLIETKDPLRKLPGEVVTTFEIDEAHPMVSFVAMIAPSPDWFTGVSAVNLRENGAWVQEKTVTLYAWDAGTDSGTTYRGFDKDMKPRGEIRMNDSAYFVMGGQRKPVGSVTFVRE